MTDLKTTLPPALSRALDLLADPPAEPDVSNGYLDLLGTAADDDVAKNSGAIQAAWASPIGSFVYDNAQALTRRFIAAMQLPIDWLDVPEGGVALDVGAGPGIDHHITGPRRRTRRARAGRRHLRADAGPRGARRGGPAGRLPAGGRAATAVPGRDFDVAMSIAVLQLIPDPAAALAEIARVLKPGGRLAVMVPTLRPPVDLWRALPTGGAHIFGEDEVGDILESNGFTSVRVKSVGTFQWVRGKRG